MLISAVVQEPRFVGGLDLGPYLERGMQRAGGPYLRELRAISPGGIAHGWLYTVDVGHNAVAGVLTNAHPGARPLNEGRRPGRFPPFAPGTPLARWAGARGIPPFLVARKIARAGITPRRFTARALEAARGDMIRIVQEQGLNAWLEALVR